MMELLKDESFEVKLKVVAGFKKIGSVVGADLLNTPVLLTTLSTLSKDGNWRVRMAVFELFAELAIIFGPEVYTKQISTHFMNYLSNSAASVRGMGIEKSATLA